MPIYSNAELEAFEAEMVEPENAALPDILANKTSNERIKWLRREFYKAEQPIQKISPPELCEKYPEFHEDIVAAYLQYTDFTAKVIVNYDGACKQFFTDDGRVQDCGKLVLNTKERAYLKKVMEPSVQMTRLILDIGTAFRTFSRIVLRAMPSGEVTAMNKPETGDHPLLMKHLNNVCADLSNQMIAKGQTGFKIDDVEQIAGWSVRQPESETLIPYRHRWGVPDEWMSEGRGFHSSPGYLGYLR